MQPAHMPTGLYDDQLLSVLGSTRNDEGPLQFPLLFGQWQQLQRRRQLKQRQKLAATLVPRRFDCLIHPSSGGLPHTSS